MRKYEFSILFFAAFALLPQIGYGKTWRGITPLISTRNDVEKLLGKPVLDDNIYDAPDGRAIISYSNGKPCEEGLPGLGNIPRDTVVEIYLSLAEPAKISEFLLPGREYIQTRAVHTPTVYYTDEVEGVQYSTSDGVVWTVSYYGSPADKGAFSCGEYKYAAPVPSNPDPMRVEQYPFDSFGKIRLEDAKARLDNFVIELLQSNEGKRDHRAVIIVYGGKSSYAREPELVAECYKDYLVKTRHADPETIVAVAGGYREEFQVELYIMPISAYPPLLMPTVSPRKVQILKGRVKALVACRSR